MNYRSHIPNLGHLGAKVQNSSNRPAEISHHSHAGQDFSGSSVLDIPPPHLPPRVMSPLSLKRAIGLGDFGGFLTLGKRDKNLRRLSVVIVHCLVHVLSSWGSRMPMSARMLLSCRMQWSYRPNSAAPHSDGGGAAQNKVAGHNARAFNSIYLTYIQF